MATFKNEIFKKRPEEFIRYALNKQGVDTFWQSSAMQQLRQALAGNRYFIQHVEAVTVSKARLGYASKVIIEGVANFPDSQKETRMRITYTATAKKSTSGAFTGKHHVEREILA